MIQKISIALLIPLLIISFFLAFNGVQHIGFGDSYYVFVRNLNSTFENWSFSIPTIPKIPKFETRSIADAKGVLEFLKLFANFFVTILNAIVVGLNVIITITNVFVHVIQFFISLISCIKDFITGNVSSVVMLR